MSGKNDISLWFTLKLVGHIWTFESEEYFHFDVMLFYSLFLKPIFSGFSNKIKQNFFLIILKTED